MKTSLLESLFNNAADLKAWNFIKKRLRRRYFPVNFFFQKTAFTEHLQMAASIDSTIPFFYPLITICFFLHFFPLLLIIAIMGIYWESV